MNTNRSILAFLAILAGFILLLSKLPPLIIAGGLLFIAGTFAPFYEDQLDHLLHRSSANPSLSPSAQADISTHTEKPSETVIRKRTDSGRDIWVAETPARGQNRALEATWLSIKKLQASLFTRSDEANTRERKIKTLSIKMSGEGLTQTEVDQTRDFVQLIFPDVDIKEEIPNDLAPDTQQHDTDTSEIIVSLAALTDE